MALEAYDDYEQGERLQRWIRQNGWSILAGLVIGLLVISGWQYWRRHQLHEQVKAARLYFDLKRAKADGQTQRVRMLLNRLKKNHAGHPYALFAVTEMAADEVRAHHLDKALVFLEWARQHASSTELKVLTQVRLARVQLALGHARAAIQTLRTIPRANDMAAVWALRGDALISLNRSAQARKAYQKALVALQKLKLPSGDLPMKISDLAIAGKSGS